ncbi:MAG: VCBS repeat-containing protein [Proteobacteria bacterium]|nr:VCBS repeat-containing protein [Pseudomonadota bacterium]
MRLRLWILGTLATIGMLVGPSMSTAGSLAYVQTLTVPIGKTPAGIGTADFNGDGRPDIAAANDSDPTVNVLLAAPGDGFLPAVPYLNACCARMQALPQSLVIADFNGDGIPDIAVPNQYGGPVFYVSVLLGKRDGTFQPQLPFATGICPVSIASGDFNGDGKIDLVTANLDGQSISVLLGNGDGTFGNHTDYPMGSASTAVATGDFNRDGKLDILVANSDSGGVSLLLGKGDGTFSAPVFFATGGNPRSIALGDVNGDGKLDAVVASGGNTVSVLLGHGDGTFAPVVNYPTGPLSLSQGYANAVALADVDRDGHLDIIVANKSGSTISIMRGLENGTFALPLSIPSGSDPAAVAVADFDGDGRPDIAVLNYQPGTVTILTNDVLFSNGFE